MLRLVWGVLAAASTILTIILLSILWGAETFPEWSYEAADGGNLPVVVLGTFALLSILTTAVCWEQTVKRK